MRTLVAVSLLVLAGCSSAGGSAPTQPLPPPSSSNATAKSTTLKVEEVTGGLEHGWDVGFLPDGSMLIPERVARFTLVRGGQKTKVDADLSDVVVRGEGGLLGLVVHPDFATSGKFTACYDTRTDIRLVTFKLDGTKATKVKDLLTGLPVNPSGRHSGCRPTLAPDGTLLVGTGDTARGNIAQDRTNLGGKLLRIDLNTGEGVPGNPFASSQNANERRIYTYGNRNIQGVALRPGTDQVFMTEHGPDVDDEVNLVKAGGNYGWDPSQGGTVGGYDESVPMTDTKRFPDAVPAVWSSGRPTEAICGAAFFDGMLAVPALKGSKLLVFSLDEQGKVTGVTIPDELNDKYGRLRAARAAPDGSLYVTSSNGNDDKLLRITRG
ncbi:glucose dehydrogenase [Lentzea sp. NBRC 105346]|uniref:PQQ-dependent sugar dehydrogenase n=1 Tax=Lentzea sp. NBRC 105346 TaxID=3032205 RepID=UPI0024A0D1EF|nr:PQQ-dependent sugar dehydrogenase [Lentzea sp. NBRC 105346]GLZ34512.1 glucose dehydrogenase [Lentzea sp. NBRC 105346]